jgi:hypothetical protein
MNIQWARSTKLLAVLLTIAVVVVGVLTALVMRQQHDLGTVNGQIRLGTAPAAPGASVPAGADIVANPNVITHPDPAATPDSANAPAGPAPQPAPISPAPPVGPAPRVVPALPAAPAGLATAHITPALVAPAPHVITPHWTAPPRQKTVTPNAPPARRVDPMPAPRQPAPAPPVTPAAPQTDPDEPVKSEVPGKPGKPDDSWRTAHSQTSDIGSDADKSAKPSTEKPNTAKPKTTKSNTSAVTPTDSDAFGSADTSQSSPTSTKTKVIQHKAPTVKVDDTRVNCPPKPVVMSPVAPDSGDFSASDLKASKQEDVQLPTSTRGSDWVPGGASPRDGVS